MNDSNSNDYDAELDSININIDDNIGNININNTLETDNTSNVNNDIHLKCKCYSLPLFHDYDKFKKLENSDKILVPMSFLKSIEEKCKEIKFPLIFEIQNGQGEGEESMLKDIGLKNNIHCFVFEYQTSPHFDKLGGLKNKNIVLSGTREVEKILIGNGINIQNTLNSKTDLLICKTVDSKSSKIVKAKELGKKIIDIKEFKNIYLS